MNLYTYCENDPIDGIDPDGHKVKSKSKDEKKEKEKKQQEKQKSKKKKKKDEDTKPKKKDSQKNKKETKKSSKKSGGGIGDFFGGVVNGVGKGISHVKDQAVGAAVGVFKSTVYDTGVDLAYTYDSIKEKVGAAKSGTAKKNKEKWEGRFDTFEKGVIKTVVGDKKQYYSGKIKGDVASQVIGSIATGKGLAELAVGFAGDKISLALGPTPAAGVAKGISWGVVAQGTLDTTVGATITKNASANEKRDRMKLAESDGDGKTYQTYTKKKEETGEIYSGRTSGTGTPAENIRNRDKSHHMNNKGFGPAELDVSSTNKNAIRGREQQLIEKHGGAKSQGGTSGNAINGIGKNNKKASIYKAAAEKEFGKYE